ncbi:MAG: hypothetical protein QXG05_05685 [Nitrososphaerota archaeon]
MAIVESQNRSDLAISQRIAEFVFTNEDLRRLVETVRSETRLSEVRTFHVEIVKSERSAFRSRRVKEILEASGLVFEPYSYNKEGADLQKAIRQKLQS